MLHFIRTHREAKKKLTSNLVEEEGTIKCYILRETTRLYLATTFLIWQITSHHANCWIRPTFPP